MSNVLNLLSEETFAEKMDIQNALLAALVRQGGGSETVEISAPSIMQKLVRLGVAANVFPIGTQLKFSNSRLGDLTWQVIGVDHDEPVDSQYTHSLTLQLIGLDVFSGTMQFDAPETGNPDLSRSSNGSNDWATSNIRQWLNSDGIAGNWWQAQSEYDKAPPYATTMNGFLNGMDPEFLAVVGSVKKTTGGASNPERFFLLSRSEVYGGMEIDEGEPYAYFSQNTTLQAAGVKADTGRIRQYKDYGAQWWLRTASTKRSDYEWAVNADGSLSDTYSVGFNSHASMVAPACCIV